MKVARSSTLHTGRLYPTWEDLRYPFLLKAASAAGRVKSFKNLKDAIGNRTRDLQACSAVLQQTAVLPTPTNELTCEIFKAFFFSRYIWQMRAYVCRFVIVYLV